MNEIDQPELFAVSNPKTSIESVVLYALGEFQARGKILSGRELALDRLLGAFRRAFEVFGLRELSDSEIVDELTHLGAKVRRVPGFVAKHPYRVTVPQDLASRAENEFVVLTSVVTKESA